MLEPGLIQNAAMVGTAFAASQVGWVEALTIGLAVSSVSSWRSGLLGAASGAVFLAAISRCSRSLQRCSHSRIYAQLTTAYKPDGLITTLHRTSS